MFKRQFSGDPSSLSRSILGSQRHRVASVCSSMSSSAVENCNRNFWVRNVEDEARKIWDFGQKLGVSFFGDDKEIVDRLVVMENRDSDESKLCDKKEEGKIKCLPHDCVKHEFEEDEDQP